MCTVLYMYMYVHRCMEEVWSMITKSLKLSEWIRPTEDETTDEEGGGGGGGGGGGTDTSSRGI